MIGWREFYKLYPFDDRHRFYRPAALISSSLGGGKLEDRLEYLQPEPTAWDLTSADKNIFAALGITPPRS
jgi:hypothetical protein